jgi:Lon protease-like protein
MQNERTEAILKLIEGLSEMAPVRAMAPLPDTARVIDIDARLTRVERLLEQLIDRWATDENAR